MFIGDVLIKIGHKEISKFGKFVNDNLRKYSNEDLFPLSNKKNEKIRVGFLSADIKRDHSITYFLAVLQNYDKKILKYFYLPTKLRKNLIQKR